ncbi:hypothetical protein SAMN04488540_10564 [Ferrimonas sediminum]|uniref:Nickel/cobalt transporter regulator n=1 Tax=Ferrimonas sediminum TaxID=718193 RepID=A0A1G8R591_9GAMM|nr:hypothetical protein [Ferrimonas sediminum]SDJ12142.1 hypothetical protein SAMN04488540_10564 [Ferrimonas sediminum]
MSLRYLLILSLFLSPLAVAKGPKNDHKPVDEKGKSTMHRQQHIAGETTPLPYGLEKKLARGEPLPPGWQRKLKVGDTLDARIIQRSSVIERSKSGNSVTIEADGGRLRIDKLSGEVLAILN